MPLVRNILSSYRFEVARVAGTCDISAQHEIRRGERHFVYEPLLGHRKNICMRCAPEVLAVAQGHLAMVIKELP